MKTYYIKNEKFEHLMSIFSNRYEKNDCVINFFDENNKIIITLNNRLIKEVKTYFDSEIYTLIIR